MSRTQSTALRDEAQQPAKANGAPVDSAGPLVEVEHLQVSFESNRGRVHAVRDVSFTLAKGTTLGVVGESGSGKSVMARSLMGLVGSSGTVTADRLVVAGVDLLQADNAQLRRLRGGQVAMVFQDPMRSLNPTMKIGTQVMEMILEHRPMSKADARRRVIELLDAVRIPAAASRADCYPHQLSGGMRQRVMIAIALAANPMLLIADEPTTALDVTVQAQILDLIADLQADFGMSLILVTHDLAVASSYTERLAIMYAGELVETGRTGDVLTQVRMPYTQALFDSIPRIDAEPHSDLVAIKGTPPDPTVPIAGCPFSNRCSYATVTCTESPPPWEGGPDGHGWRCWHPLQERINDAGPC